MRKPNQTHLAYIAAAVTIVLWAFPFPASKTVLPFFQLEEIVLLRHIVGAVFFLLLFAVAEGRFPLPKFRHIPYLLLLGVLGIATYHLLFVYSIGLVTAGAAAMLITTGPVFVSILAYIFLREKLSVPIWCGIGIAICGVLLITFTGRGGEVLGYLAMCAAMVAISVYFILQKRLFKTYSPLLLTAYAIMGGTLPLLYFLPAAFAAATAAPPHALRTIALMGIFSSGIGYFLWAYALSHLRAGIVSSFLFLQPLLVTLLAWGWLGEIPPARAFIGGFVILCGLALILRPRKPR